MSSDPVEIPLCTPEQFYVSLTTLTLVRFDVETRHAFVGDQSGQVTILKVEQDSCSMVTTFKGHTGLYSTQMHATRNNR